MFRLFFLAALVLLPLATDTGFSVALWTMLAADLGLRTEFIRSDSFGGMLDMVINRQVDGAIANISITAEREAIMDFSQPHIRQRPADHVAL